MAKRKEKRPARAATRKKKPARVQRSAAPPWVPKGANYMMPYLTVKDVLAECDFCETVLGFGDRRTLNGGDGSTTHAEILYEGQWLMVGPEGQGAIAPSTCGGTPLTLYLYVRDVDAVAARAAQAGATILMHPQDQVWGDRCAMFADPEGHRWMIATHVRDVSLEEIQQQSGTT